MLQLIELPASIEPLVRLVEETLPERIVEKTVDALGKRLHGEGLREGLNKCILHFSDAQSENAPESGVALLTCSVANRH